jgi:hypothetical protein
MAPETLGDWAEYRRLILQELQRLHDDIEDVKGQIGTLQSGIAVLNFKAGVWGFMAGAIPGVSAALYVIAKG